MCLLIKLYVAGKRLLSKHVDLQMEGTSLIIKFIDQIKKLI